MKRFNSESSGKLPGIPYTLCLCQGHIPHRIFYHEQRKYKPHLKNKKEKDDKQVRSFWFCVNGLKAITLAYATEETQRRDI